MDNLLLLDSDQIVNLSYDDMVISLWFDGFTEDDYHKLYDKIFLKYKSGIRNEYIYLKCLLCSKKEIVHISNDDGIFTRLIYDCDSIYIITQEEFKKNKRKYNSF